MHKNLIWQAFLIIVLAIALMYTIIAGYRYYNYSILKEQTLALDMKWSIEEIDDEDYILTADYKFNATNHIYQGSTSWPKRPYRNQYAAQKAIEEHSKQRWIVWYNPSNPEHSTLEKDFPLKEIIYAIVLWGLFLYYLWISFYVAKFKT